MSSVHLSRREFVAYVFSRDVNALKITGGVPAEQWQHVCVCWGGVL